jgi:hypothetical protein
VNAESPAQGRASADGRYVEDKPTARGGHGEALTIKQRTRWSPLTVDGILVRPATTAQAHDLAMALGKVMRKDRTFEPLRNEDDLLCVEVRTFHRDRVRKLLGLSPWSWGEYVRQWEAVGLAHRCDELKRGAVRLFDQPEPTCPVCGNVAGSNTERGSQQRSPLPGATETVLTAGDASSDAEGDGWEQLADVGGSALGSSPAPTGSSETAPRILLERALGLDDRSIAALLNGESIPPPAGFHRWTGTAVRTVIEETTHAA